MSSEQVAPRIPGEEMTANVERHERLRDRITGVLLGGAVADALGWPTEFIKSGNQAKKLFGTDYVSDFLPWEKKTGGRFNTYIDYIQPGEYSDDTQLTLCTVRCIKEDGSFDPVRFTQELRYWLSYARGAGGTITRAARAIQRRHASWDSNFFTFETRGRTSDYTQAGANGAAMRIAPHTLANVFDKHTGMDGVWRNAIITHGHPRAIWGALTYAKALHVLISSEKQSFDGFLKEIRDFIQDQSIPDNDSVLRPWLERWMSWSTIDFRTIFDETKAELLDSLILVSSARGKPLHEIYRSLGCFAPSTRGSGTATVAAALAVFLRHGGNYEHAVLKAINMFGSDTDTIAAMVGSMIGALKGDIAIPDRWVNKMQDFGYFVRASEALTRIALREAKANDLLVDHARETIERRDRDIVSLAQMRQIYKGQRITHPLFGLGWVLNVSAQQIKRKDAGTMLLARVEFDTGQTCIFRSYRSATSKQP